MTNRDAIKAIKMLNDKLYSQKENPIPINMDNWQTQAISVIHDYFGRDSIEFARITNFKIMPVNGLYKMIANSDHDIEVDIQQNMIELSDFLLDCIETIKHKSEKTTHNNFLTRRSNGAIITVLLAIIGGIGSPLCWMFRRASRTTDKVDL